jgi:thiol:disulfide interchange protein DsbD
LRSVRRLPRCARGGEQLGWGFQLQSPAVVSALAILFFVLALNLSGVFEFGQLAPSGVTGWTSKNRTLDAFASGILAVVIASPARRRSWVPRSDLR